MMAPLLSELCIQIPDFVKSFQRQIQDFPKGGAWVIAGMDFHTWTFCSGTYHAMHGQNVNRQNTGGQNTSQNCKVGQNAGTGKAKFQSYQKNCIYDTDGQVN